MMSVYSRSDMYTQMGNLTCVLKHLGLLDSAGKVTQHLDKHNLCQGTIFGFQVSLAYMTGQYWNTLDLSNTLAGKDPVFRANINNRITDCYNMANVNDKLDPGNILLETNLLQYCLEGSGQEGQSLNFKFLGDEPCSLVTIEPPVQGCQLLS